MGSLAENPFLIDEEQDKENSPTPPTPPATPVSERPTQPHLLMGSRPFATKFENVPDYLYRNLFEKLILFLLCMYFNINNS